MFADVRSFCKRRSRPLVAMRKIASLRHLKASLFRTGGCRHPRKNYRGPLCDATGPQNTCSNGLTLGKRRLKNGGSIWFEVNSFPSLKTPLLNIRKDKYH